MARKVFRKELVNSFTSVYEPEWSLAAEDLGQDASAEALWLIEKHVLAGGMQREQSRECAFVGWHVDIRTQIGAVTGWDMDIPQDFDAGADLRDLHIGGIDQTPELAENLFRRVFLFNEHWVRSFATQAVIVRKYLL